MTTADEPGGMGAARRVLGQLIDAGAELRFDQRGRYRIIEGVLPLPYEVHAEVYSNREELRELLRWDKDTADRLLMDTVRSCLEHVDPAGPEVEVLGPDNPEGVHEAYEAKDMYRLRAILRDHVRWLREGVRPDTDP